MKGSNLFPVMNCCFQSSAAARMRYHFRQFPICRVHLYWDIFILIMSQKTRQLHESHYSKNDV